MKISCAHCGDERDIPNGWAKRSIAQGMKLYCTRKCSGLARRKPEISIEEKKNLKREYDIRYRAENKEKLRQIKVEYFKRTYDPVAAAIERKKNMPRHVAYCRRPEYRQYKQGYDRHYRAKTEYGEFFESFLLLQDIEKEIGSRATRYEIYCANGTVNKTQKRKREYERLNSNKSENIALGNP